MKLSPNLPISIARLSSFICEYIIKGAIKSNRSQCAINAFFIMVYNNVISPTALLCQIYGVKFKSPQIVQFGGFCPAFINIF